MKFLHVFVQSGPSAVPPTTRGAGELFETGLVLNGQEVQLVSGSLRVEQTYIVLLYDHDICTYSSLIL